MKGFFARAMEAARDYLSTPLKAPLIFLQQQMKSHLWTVLEH